MLLKDLAIEYGITEGELKKYINEEITEDFIKINMSGDDANELMVNTIATLMKKIENKKKSAENNVFASNLPMDDIPPMDDDDIPPMDDDDISPMDDELPEPSDADTESENEFSKNSTDNEENTQESKNTNAEGGFEGKPADDEDDTEDDIEDADENNEIADENEEDKSRTDESEKPRTRKRRKTDEPVTIDSDIGEVPAIELRKFLAENFSVKPEKIFFMDDAGVKEKVDERYIVISRNDAFVFIKRTASMIVLSK